MALKNLENKKKDDVQTVQAKYGKDSIQAKQFVLK